MLTKCKKETTEISLTEFIDSQPEEIRKQINFHLMIHIVLDELALLK